MDLRQKARLRLELSPEFLSTLSPNPTRKARADLQFCYAPFWCRSVHTHLIDPIINNALRALTANACILHQRNTYKFLRASCQLRFTAASYTLACPPSHRTETSTPQHDNGPEQRHNWPLKSKPPWAFR